MTNAEKNGKIMMFRLSIVKSGKKDCRERFKLRDKLFTFLDELEKNDAQSFQALQMQVSLLAKLEEKFS